MPFKRLSVIIILDGLEVHVEMSFLSLHITFTSQ